MSTDRPSTTERRLREVTIGPLQRLTDRIELAPSDPGWPAQFEREAARIRFLLGAGALLLEHVGSTSVPGMPAKPIIDILLVVADSGDETSYLPRLEGGGYVLRIREPAWHEHRMCKGPDTDVNLHIFSVGSSEITRMVAFRDRLRSDPEAFDRYLASKRALAANDWEFLQQYADAKSKVVESIIARELADRPA